MIDRPFHSSSAWALYFTKADLPVLRRSVQNLQSLRDTAESANARLIANTVMHDPLLTLRVLQYIEKHRGKNQITDITTIERALVMIGIGPFFRDFENLPAIEDHLKHHPKALLGLLKVIARAHKASSWARDWAVTRHDLDTDEVTLAALLRYISEMLMWCFAPTLALSAREMQEHDHNLRSSVIQGQVYHVKLDELQIELAHQMHLPELLTTLMDPEKADNPRVKNVKLACDLARHSANGWDDAALPDDYAAICELLRIDNAALMTKLGLDAEGKSLPKA
jgi:HD-like signal output (HDOD) protein